MPKEKPNVSNVSNVSKKELVSFDKLKKVLHNFGYEQPFPIIETENSENENESGS